jgi:predicted NAD/FAD-dependent oxidoreductase
MSPAAPRVAVIGGGLAGITAAIALAEAGAAVTLLEARPRLGGATSSFTRDGLVVDTGQHVFLGCCTAYRGLLGQLGMTAHAPVQDRFDVTVLAPGPKGGQLRRAALPGPLHMLPALARYPFLSLAERAVVSRPALALRGVDPADPATDEQRFGDFLVTHGQSDRARRALWDLFTVSALNVAGDDASLSLAATVVQTGLLGRSNAADIGVPARPLGELHGDAAAALLAKLGAQVLLGAKVAAIEPAASSASSGLAASSASAYRVRLARPLDPTGPLGTADPADSADSADSASKPSGATELLVDAVVLAVPHEAAARLIPPGALPDSTVAAWAGLSASPIVNVHVIYDRPVMDVPFAAAVDSPVQWVFDRTGISGLDRLAAPASPGADGTSRPQYLAISLSAADEYVDVPAATLRERFLPALAELFPAAREARVAEFFVTRERRATFRQVPGTGKLRPRAGTQLPGLVLAGAWTDTGWPDTMESAVRSGLAAAIELRRTVLSVPGLSRSGSSRTRFSRTRFSRTGLSRAGISRSGSPDPVLSGSEVNASTSTMGVRQ